MFLDSSKTCVQREDVHVRHLHTRPIWMYFLPSFPSLNSTNHHFHQCALCAVHTRNSDSLRYTCRSKVHPWWGFLHILPKMLRAAEKKIKQDTTLLLGTTANTELLALDFLISHRISANERPSTPQREDKPLQGNCFIFHPSLWPSSPPVPDQVCQTRRVFPGCHGRCTCPICPSALRTPPPPGISRDFSL